MDQAAIADLIRKATWYHGWEIVPGVHTPGWAKLEPRGHLTGMGIEPDLKGLRAIDIGTYDGPLAFALEARGADVVAADIQDPDRTGFNTAKAILGSRVTYLRSSVYDLSANDVGRFDVIVFSGVYYHLKYPIMAFEELGRLSHSATKLYVEGECLIDYAETLDGSPAPVPEWARSDVPVCLNYPGIYKGTSNWNVPNLACLKGWLACGGFRLESHQFLRDKGSQRVILTAVRAPDPLTHMADSDDGRLIEHPFL